MWHHVDGAYGAFFHAVPELRHLLAGLPRAVHSATAGYLPERTDEFYDPSQYGPELSRGFPGLRVWLAMKMFGAERYRAAIAEKRALAVQAAEQAAAISGVVMDARPQLSLFAFHPEGPHLTTQAARNAATAELMERVTARGRVMLTGCTVDGRHLARICVLSFRTRAEQMVICVEHIAEETARILGR